jgi:crotonobetainyl-CoA:carnitine CoA-transferase CaiB-like acyl-CoA transferase
MALYHRDRQGGSGQVVDVALYEAVFSLMESLVPEYDMKGIIRERTGSVLPGITPSNIYLTKDGKYIVLAGNGDNIFQRLLRLMGKEEWIGDERFKTNDKRSQHADMIDEVIGNWVKQYELKECLKMLSENGIPAGPIYNVKDMVEDPHYLEREMIVEMHHPDVGKMKVPGIVPKLSKTPGELKWLGPRIGEHNIEVLKEIGLSEEQIEQLKTRGII